MTKVKRRDRRYLKWRVTNPETGDIQDLTGCTVRLLIREQYSDDEATPYPMEIDGNPVDGVVRYFFDGTISAGTYEIEAETTSSSGTIITSPTEGYNILLVEPDLG